MDEFIVIYKARRGYVQNISRIWRVRQKRGDYRYKTSKGKWYVLFISVFQMPWGLFFGYGI